MVQSSAKAKQRFFNGFSPFKPEKISVKSIALRGNSEAEQSAERIFRGYYTTFPEICHENLRFGGNTAIIIPVRWPDGNFEGFGRRRGRLQCA